MRSLAGAWVVAIVAVGVLTAGCLRDGQDAHRREDRTVEATPASTTPVQTTSTAPVAPPLEGRVVLVVGDSVMWDATPALVAGIEANGGIVVPNAVLGFGLGRVQYYDWRREWPALLEQVRPTDVLVNTGPWDFGPRVTPAGEVVALASDQWGSYMANEVGEAIGVLSSQGAHVWWLTTPPFERAGWAEPVAVINRAIADASARSDRATVVPTFVALADASGRYQPGGRKDDGVHLCADGAAAVAKVVVPALGGAVAATWVEGAWRTDGRYVVGLEGGRCSRA